MWSTYFALLIVAPLAFGAPASLCPRSCSCTSAESENGIEVHCPSFFILNRAQLSGEQLAAITRLKIDDDSVVITVPNLTYLHKVKHLDLAGNKIEKVPIQNLPRSLVSLDLSRNAMVKPPLWLQTLPDFKELNLSDNPLVCDCVATDTRDILLMEGINLTKTATCKFPDDLREIPWLSADCMYYTDEKMQGDGTEEGSGFGELSSTTESELENPGTWDTPMEEEFIRVGAPLKVEAAVTAEGASDTEVVEGSGYGTEVTTGFDVLVHGSPTTEADYDDEDYGDSSDAFIETPAYSSEAPFNISHLEKLRVKACNFNCSTESPNSIDSNDTDASPAPGLIEGFAIVIHDLDVLKNSDPEPITTTTTSTTSTTTTTPPPSVIDVGAVTAIHLENDTSDAEIMHNNLIIGGDKENIREASSGGSNTTFIFLSVLLLIILCLVIYAIVKKRQKRQEELPVYSSDDSKDPIGEEMKLIKKSALETAKPNGTHEAIPLMNGHKENQHRDAEDASTPDGNGVQKPVEGDEDVELRQKVEDHNHLLTPETKRVTIKASEIPNSTPKTPILVTRHINSDGNIITTPSVDQLV